RHESGRPLELKLRGAGYKVRVARVGAQRFRVGLEAGDQVRTADVELDRFDRHAGQIVVNGVRYRLLTGTHGPVHLVEVDGVAHRISQDEGGVVRSPAPALVVATPLEVGAEVEAGAPVLVLESMKMETVLRAPFRARLKECLVSVGGQVETGAPLLRLEPLGDAAAEETAGTAAADLDLPGGAESVPPHERAVRVRRDLRGLLLGFDADPYDESRTLEDYLAARRAAVQNGDRPLAAELDLLTAFADLAELGGSRPAGPGFGGGAGTGVGRDGHVHSPREYFHTYLQSLDVERAGLPDDFQDRLRRAFAHYGVTELDRSPELEAAVFRIFLAQQRASGHASAVTALLRAWLEEQPPGGEL
ncbi:biotin/lipoyl-containing protein, partial [Spirillospora sp. NPDC049652]